MTAPKIIEGLSLQEALEGLRDGRYTRAQPEWRGELWAHFSKGELRYSDSGRVWPVTMGQISAKWRAEVAGLKVPWHVAIAGLFSGEYSEAETGDPGRERVVVRDDLLCSDGDTFCICGIDLGDWTVTPARKGGE